MGPLDLGISLLFPPAEARLRVQSPGSGALLYQATLSGGFSGMFERQLRILLTVGGLLYATAHAQFALADVGDALIMSQFNAVSGGQLLE